MTFTYLTPEEEFRITGSITGKNAIELLEVHPMYESLTESLDGNLNDALASMVDESGVEPLDDVISRLQELVKRLRGNNKEELQEIVAALEEAKYTLVQSGEYGIECLQKISKAY